MAGDREVRNCIAQREFVGAGSRRRNADHTAFGGVTEEVSLSIDAV
jgi:hypothetical protein